MGITEKHWFEDEEPELTERQLEDIVYENKRAYDSGYAKGYSARDNEIVRCKECKHRSKEVYYKYDIQKPEYKVYVCQINDVAKRPDWFCADGEREKT